MSIKDGDLHMSIRSIQVSHIVLSTEELARVLLDHFNEDEYKDREMLFKMFAKMAKKYSACGSRNKGGDLGLLEHNTAAPELERAAMAAPVGEVQGPIKSKFGYHIFLITKEEEMKDMGIDGLTTTSFGAGDGTL